MSNILFVVPVALGLPRAEFCLSLMASVMALQRAGHNTGFAMDESGSIVRSRNLGAAQVLNDPTWTHLAFADADMSWSPADVFLRMLEQDKMVICGVYVTKWGAPRWTMHTHGNPQDVKPDGCGLVPLQDAPTGLMLIKREALELLAEKRPDLKINFDSVVERPDAPGGRLVEPGTYLFFDARRSGRSGKGHYVSDDYGFSETWESVQGRIWAYPWVTISHHFTTANTACLGEWLEGIGVQGLERPEGW